MVMKAEESKDKFQRYEQRKRDRGYVKKHPWIPERDAAKFEAYVNRLAKAYERDKEKGKA